MACTRSGHAWSGHAWSGHGWLYTLCLTALLLSGCAANKSKTASVEAEEDKGAPIALVANPYLAQKIDVPAAAEEQFRTAVVLMQGENWAQAEQKLRVMTEAFPELAGPFVNLGISLWRQGKIDEAEKAFAQAISINPLHNDVYVQYGVMLREQGEFDRAEQVYLDALEVWPHNLPVLRNLGILYDLYMGKHEQALAQYELALRVMPEPSREMQGWIIDLKRRLASQ